VPCAGRGRLVERSAEPCDGGAEIFCPFAVEAFLICAEACDAVADLLLDIAVDDRQRRARRSLDWHVDRLDRLFRRELEMGGVRLGSDLGRCYGRKFGFQPHRFPCRFRQLPDDRLNEGICLCDQRIALSLPVHRTHPTQKPQTGFDRASGESSQYASSFWG
jgi:hypothetical protein